MNLNVTQLDASEVGEWAASPREQKELDSARGRVLYIAADFLPEADEEVRPR